MTDMVIVGKARRLQSSLFHTLPEEERLHCKFSQGWLYRFKLRHNFKRYRSHGKESAADLEGATAALPHLRELAAQYELVDVCNADEFGLYYTATPTSAVGPAPLKARKSQKTESLFWCVAT